jgi:hypothetical protein
MRVLVLLLSLSAAIAQKPPSVIACRVIGAGAPVAGGEIVAGGRTYVTDRLVSSAGDFYGGFIGALIASAIFFRRHPQLPFWRG